MKFEESGKVPLSRRELEKTSANLEKGKYEKILTIHTNGNKMWYVLPCYEKLCHIYFLLLN